MKKCTKCGALQSDERNLCIDCGALLGASMSEAEENRAEEALDAALTGMTERAEDFHISPAERILGIVSILAVAVMIVVVSILGGRKDALQIPDGVYVDRGDGVTVILGTEGEEITGQVQAILRQRDAIDHSIGYALLGMVLLGFSAIFFLLPKVVWWLSTLRWRFYSDAEPTPSALYMAVDKFLKYCCCAVGVGAFALSLVGLF